MSAFNGAGTFVISGTGLPFVTGTTISSTVVNQLDTDLATGLSNVICKDGQTTPTANIPLGGFKVTGLGVPTALGDALGYGNPGAMPNLTLTSSSTSALAVGLNGLTNPAFLIDTSTALSVTGLKIKSHATGLGIALSGISSATNEALSIDAKGSGAITIGNTSTGNVTIAASGSNILLVGTGTTQTANIVTASNSTNDGISVLGDNTATRGMMAFRNPNGQVGSITTAASATSFNTSSDERLKTNIVDAADAGNLLDALRVRAWNWKIDGAFEPYGFVAQEEIAVYAPAVTAGDDSTDKITVPWGRDDSKLVPLLVKEIQSLRARVAALGG